MMVDAEIIQTLAKMPEPLKTELLHYAKYLIANYSEADHEKKLPQKKRQACALKGTFFYRYGMILMNRWKTLRNTWSEFASFRYPYVHLVL